MYEFLNEGVNLNTLGQTWRRPRRQLVKPRVLLGVGVTAAGYALAGLPGAAIGAAASFLARRFDASRVG